jgi:hypothetical protein
MIELDMVYVSYFRDFFVKAAENLSNKIFCLAGVSGLVPMPRRRPSLGTDTPLRAPAMIVRHPNSPSRPGKSWP